MKNKLINEAIFVIACALVIGLRPRFGLYNSVLLCGPLVAMVLFVIAWLKAKCSLLSYISLLHGRVTDFVTNTAKNYNSVKWYLLPKYWLVGLFAVYQIVHILLASLYGWGVDLPDSVVVSWSWFLILFPFLLCGYRTAFYVLLAISFAWLVYGLSWQFSYRPLLSCAACLWGMAWMYLIILCLRIERLRNKLSWHRKPILKDILTSCGIALCLFVVIIIHGSISLEKAKRGKYADCMRFMTMRIETSKRAAYCECYKDNIFKKSPEYWKEVADACKAQVGIDDPEAGYFKWKKNKNYSCA